MVDYDLFLEWANNYFGSENIKLKNSKHGTEICTHSVWSEEKIGKVDRKFHLWMNPTGGSGASKDRNIREYGAYRCWLTDTMGTLVSLVARLEKIDFDDAETLICGAESLRSLEQKVHKMFDDIDVFAPPKSTPIVVETKTSMQKSKLEFPPETYKVYDFEQTNYIRKKAIECLTARKMDPEDFYVCIGGDYKNRIIIPYYDKYENLIFYNGRAISEKSSLRYLKCSNEFAKHDEVLFFTNYPKPKSKIYIMEGEFDALSLHKCGFNAVACGGKYMSESQINLIRDYIPVLAFDSDGPGLKALLDVGRELISNGFEKISYIRPPSFYKDWNNLYVKKNESVVRQYIEKHEKPFNSDTEQKLRISSI